MLAPGSNVTVTIEVGYCPFCRRTRNLRREERHMGGLIRTTLECESCHRVLSSNIGPPPPTPAPPAVDVVEAVAPEPAAAPGRKKPAAKRAPAAKKPAAHTRTVTRKTSRA